jgi:hypothetical protein
MVKDINTAFIMAAYHVVMVQLQERATPIAALCVDV